MRSRLRTLLIVLAVAPPLVTGLWWTGPLGWAFGLFVAIVPALLFLWPTFRRPNELILVVLAVSVCLGVFAAVYEQMTDDLVYSIEHYDGQ